MFTATFQLEHLLQAQRDGSERHMQAYFPSNRWEEHRLASLGAGKPPQASHATDMTLKNQQGIWTLSGSSF